MKLFFAILGAALLVGCAARPLKPGWSGIKSASGFVGAVQQSENHAAAGLALIILPTLLVGNELLILAVALGGVGLYWFSHRHGKARGELETLKR